MYRRNLRDKPQSPIFKQSIEAFGRELADFFRDKASIPVYLLKTENDLKDMREDTQTQRFGVPFFTYQLDSLELATDRGNRGSLRRLGKLKNKVIRPVADGRLDDPWMTYKVLNLTRANVPINIAYYCDFDDLYDFGPLWQQAAESNYLNFSIFTGEDETSLEIKIAATLNPDVTYSSQDFSDASFAKATMTAVLHTYHGVESDIKPATSMKVTTGIVSRSEEPNKQIQKSLEITKKKSRVFNVKYPHEGE